MEIASTAPHDFYLTLDVDEYFEEEYDPMAVFRRGFVRPLVLEERDVLAVVQWNESAEEPVFHVEFPDHRLTSAEEAQAERALRRTFGCDLDLEGFYERVADDEVLGPIVERHWGFRRLSRANFYEDAMRSIIRTRISHGPTKKKMVRQVRESWGQTFLYEGTEYHTYPRPSVLAEVDPVAFREYGVSKRKGEYITGMAREIAEGELDLEALEEMPPEEFYERAMAIRGIGPSTAQSLMLRRNRSDAYFPSHKSGGKEKGVRRWILMSYGMDPHETPEQQWQELRDRWRGYETLVSQYFYYDWLMSQKESDADS